MSIERCDKHDRHYDTDKVEACPQCEAALDTSDLQGWGLLLRPPIKHVEPCAFQGPMEDGKIFARGDESCTCGYEWRVRLADYMAAYNAWRTRADRAEAALAEAQALLERCRTILGNMAQENEGAIFNRWPISHEPLRNDARGILPELDAAIDAARKGTP